MRIYSVAVSAGKLDEFLRRSDPDPKTINTLFEILQRNLEQVLEELHAVLED